MQKNTTNCEVCCSTPQKWITRFYNEYRFVAFFGWCYGIILYSLMMTQQLTNTFDGLWKQNYHNAGAEELSSGRWLLTFVDNFVMGTHADPITSVLSLSLFIVGFLLVLELFKIKSKLARCLCLAIFISSPLISNTLSYRFTSLGYGLAYLLAALSAYTIIKIKHHGIAICLTGILLGLSFSCYQAYLAAFFIIIVFYAIFRCKDTAPIIASAPSKSVAYFFLRIICCLFVAALFYIVSLSLCLKLYGVNLSNYNGGNQISLRSLVVNLPQNALKTYPYFKAYFFGNKLRINCLESFGIFYCLMALLFATIVLIAIKAWKAKTKRLLLLLLAISIIPIASNAYMLIEGDKLELQMTAGLAMFVPLVLLISFSCLEEKHIAQVSCAILCIALLYGNSMQAWIDQEAMYEGQNACDTMISQVINDLNDENLLSSDYEYYFIGVPEENSLFSVSNIYYSANAYAQMGRFWVNGNCCQESYSGLIEHRLGLNLPMSYMLYENVSDKIDVLSMPEFPHDGYIKLLDEHTVVIKVSEYKAYTGSAKYVID